MLLANAECEFPLEVVSPDVSKLKNRRVKVKQELVGSAAEAQRPDLKLQTFPRTLTKNLAVENVYPEQYVLAYMAYKLSG